MRKFNSTVRLLLVIVVLIVSALTLFNEFNKKIFEANLTNVDRMNLNERFEPKAAYDQIECIQHTKLILNTSTALCIYDKRDYLTRVFLKYGIFEEVLLVRFLKKTLANRDWLVFDIGAQVGLYTLYAASVGAKVLAVEPFYDNQLRLHKAAVLARRQDRIVLVKNALSNKRNEIKRLNRRIDNIGAQGIIHNETYSNEFKSSLSSDDSKYYVRTILFDDLIDYIPLNDENRPYQKAIMKIDIEAYEPYAFQHASKLFDRIKICMLFMEWVLLKKKDYFSNEIEDMLDFLYSRGYTPHNQYEVELLRENYKKSWSFDIIWKRKDC
jgi:FkbM family methyltransferase